MLASSVWKRDPLNGFAKTFGAARAHAAQRKHAEGRNEEPAQAGVMGADLVLPSQLFPRVARRRKDGECTALLHPRVQRLLHWPPLRRGLARPSASCSFPRGHERGWRHHGFARGSRRPASRPRDRSALPKGGRPSCHPPPRSPPRDPTMPRGGAPAPPQVRRGVGWESGERRLACPLCARAGSAVGNESRSQPDGPADRLAHHFSRPQA